MKIDTSLHLKSLYDILQCKSFMMNCHSAYASHGLWVQSCAQNSSENTDPTKVLSRWHGDWERVVTINKSRWIPKKTIKKGVMDTKFILNKKYQESYVKDSDSESKEINRYDEASKKYNKWIFNKIFQNRKI